MKVNQISSLKKFIISQQNHWVFFGVVYFFMVVVPMNPIRPGLPLLIWFMLGFLPYLFYIVSRATNSTVLFWGIHLLAVIFAVLLPTPHFICRIAYLGCTILYCIHSFFARYTKEGTEEKGIPVVVSFGITFTLIFFLQFWQLYEYQRIFVNILVINIFLYCLTQYVENYTKFLSVNKHSVGYMPVENIFYIGISGMGIFAFLGSAILIFIANQGEMNDVVHRLIQVLADSLRKIKMTFRKKGASDVIIMEEAESEMVKDYYLAEEAGTSPVWDILATVLFYAIIVYVLYKIITLLPYILRFFKIPAKIVQEEELLITDVRESVESIGKKQRKSIMTVWENLTPAQRIRRHYKKRVEGTKDFISSKGKKDCMEWYTARECAHILNVPDMSDLYEKARYSPYECTTEDAKKMKEVCKQSKI